ncbi:META domain-containing protein [Tessaracoccus sp. HDW20]|uniref:META domain-containing protein n=1 Tax=Tessaracoccus coleopterorum TaxID=2714950 RepID=UPI0018D3F74D|nr:META domain-containing protein [Tessaracoccus coleopterorum]NHB85010.1 META domain-containing protein [Tessaracoccus coleopterorum]
MNKPLWITALAGCLLMTACASAVPADQPTADDLVGVTWVLEDLGGKKPVAGSPVTVRFAEGAIAGSSGCNRFGGTYEIDGAELTVDETLPATMMACAEDVMAVEASLFASLPKATGFAVDGDTLTLKDGDGTTLGTFTAQTQDLTGTSWVVTGYNNGKGGVVSTIVGSEASLEFGDDGALSGSGGCNRLTGSYTATDGAVSFDHLASTGMACLEPEGLMEQESAFLAALGTAATYSIEGDQLELRTADDAIALSLTRA